MHQTSTSHRKADSCRRAEVDHVCDSSVTAAGSACMQELGNWRGGSEEGGFGVGWYVAG